MYSFDHWLEIQLDIKTKIDEIISQQTINNQKKIEIDNSLIKMENLIANNNKIYQKKPEKEPKMGNTQILS